MKGVTETKTARSPGVTLPSPLQVRGERIALGVYASGLVSFASATAAAMSTKPDPVSLSQPFSPRSTAVFFRISLICL